MPKNQPVITDIPEMHAGWLFDPPDLITRIHLWKLDPLEFTVIETETNDSAVLEGIKRILTPDFAERDILPDDTSFLYNPTFVLEIYGDKVDPKQPLRLFVVGNIIMQNMSCSTVCCAPKHDHLSTELWDALEKIVEGKPHTRIPFHYGWIFRFDPILSRDKDYLRRFLKDE